MIYHLSFPQTSLRISAPLREISYSNCGGILAFYPENYLTQSIPMALPYLKKKRTIELFYSRCSWKKTHTKAQSYAEIFIKLSFPDLGQQSIISLRDFAPLREILSHIKTLREVIDE